MAKEYFKSILEAADKARIEYERVAAAPAAPAPDEPNPELESARAEYENAMSQVIEFLNIPDRENRHAYYGATLRSYKELEQHIIDYHRLEEAQENLEYMGSRYEEALRSLKTIGTWYRIALNFYEIALAGKMIEEGEPKDFSNLLNDALTAGKQKITPKIDAVIKELNAAILQDRDEVDGYMQLLDENPEIAEEVGNRLNHLNQKAYNIFLSICKIKAKFLEAGREADAAEQEYLEAKALAEELKAIFEADVEDAAATPPPDAWDVAEEIMPPAEVAGLSPGSCASEHSS